MTRTTGKVYNQFSDKFGNEYRFDNYMDFAKLAKQANNLLRYELDRAKAEAKLHEYNTRNKTEFSIREIEDSAE